MVATPVVREISLGRDATLANVIAPRLTDLSFADFHSVIADLGRAPESFTDGSVLSAVDELCGVETRELDDERLADDGWALLFIAGAPTDAELAQVRNGLWPWVHCGALYRCNAGSITRETLQGRRALAGTCRHEGVLLAAQRREHVLSPRATAAKFDANSGGWNGEPGKPGYAHFRWMRKYVALFGEPAHAKAILDFGCGAGWVGIEAALAAREARLSAFDPAPEMVRIAGDNARASGLRNFQGQVGFGEAPPFAGPFDLVISSGVVSFSPDQSRWFDGLVHSAARGARIVIGDLNRESRGMRQRRATKPLLPAREMNALIASEVRAELERRGCTHEATAGYQLTRPMPQLAHLSDTKLAGALSPLLLAYNKLRAGSPSGLSAFDSWVMRVRARG